MSSEPEQPSASPEDPVPGPIPFSNAWDAAQRYAAEDASKKAPHLIFEARMGDNIALTLPSGSAAFMLVGADDELHRQLSDSDDSKTVPSELADTASSEQADAQSLDNAYDEVRRTWLV